MIRLKDLITEQAMPKKGDAIASLEGENGVINSVSRGVAYVKFEHTAEKGFEAVHLQHMQPAGHRRWKEVEGMHEAVATRKAPKIGEYVLPMGKSKVGKVTRVDSPSVYVNTGADREEEFFIGQLKKTRKTYRNKPIWREV